MTHSFASWQTRPVGKNKPSAGRGAYAIRALRDLWSGIVLGRLETQGLSRLFSFVRDYLKPRDTRGFLSLFVYRRFLSRIGPALLQCLWSRPDASKWRLSPITIFVAGNNGS